MKLRTSFLFLGTAMFVMVCTFFGVGLIPLRVIMNPKYSSSDLPKND